MGDFKDLAAWKRSRALVDAAYRASAGFPLDERFGLTDQLRRAAVSVSANFVEGNSRFAPADQARFYRIALGSARECEAMVILAEDRGYVSPTESQPLLEVAREVQRILVGLLRYCRRRLPKPPPP
jgi:four helix bundle protein